MIKRDKAAVSSEDFLYEPESVYEQINKYGTYNIQPTNSTENAFPKIAQGLPKLVNRKIKEGIDE